MQKQTESFTLFLPSNSSAQYYDNTTSHFTTRLLDPISLDPAYNWEVALTELQYPISWINIRDGHNRVDIRVSKQIDSSEDNRLADSEKGALPYRPYSQYSDFMEYFVKPGAYFNVQQLNSEFQNAYDLWKRQFPKATLEVGVDSVTRKGIVKANDLEVVFKGDDVARVLGFKVDTGNGWLSEYTSTERSRFMQDFTAIFCYSDIVEMQNVGDTRARLLRIVPVTGTVGQVVYHTFDTPTYLKISRTVFQSIEIELRDDTGDYVQFEYGKVIATMHLRKSI